MFSHLADDPVYVDIFELQFELSFLKHRKLQHLIHLLLKAFIPTMSEALGPYVGLIITNCIIMGRCEAFAQNNRGLPSLVDGMAIGFGYSFVLIVIAVVRETLGFGTLLGFRIMPDGFTPWTIMIVAPGAFFVLGVFIWFVRALTPEPEKAKAR